MSTHNALPCWFLFFVKFSFQSARDFLVLEALVHVLERRLDDLLLEVLLHVHDLDHGACVLLLVSHSVRCL